MIFKWLAKKGWSLPVPAKFLRPLIWLKSRLHGVTLGVRILVRDDQGRVLLVRHTYVKGWFLPGGGILKGEFPRDAAKRELREETGLIALSEPELFGYYLNNRNNIRDYVACYLVTDWRYPGSLSSLSVLEGDGEIVEMSFFDPGALPEGVSAGTEARIVEMLGDKPVTDIW